ncbi:MAG: serine/threonine-protein kinase [Verrucomicrobiales bacterium]|nr:serine/threonine-protein kinase [Verrucomicrobiales bacterium]
MSASASQPTRCPVCGASIAPGSPAGHCPACLVRISLSDAGIEPRVEADDSPRMIGDYELLEEVARGGMGVVYRARQRTLDRIIALKLLVAGEYASLEARQRFRVEAETTAQLQHPGIVAVHDVGETEGLPWLAMDFVEGKNLGDLVREQPLPGRRAAEIVRTVAEALQHAHERGVLHRDLKPSNILIDAEGRPRVTDFGVARRFDRDATLTSTGQVLGSPGYIAPEQAFGSGSAVGPPTDVYGLGALLYHLLAGRPSFQAPTLDAILLQLRDRDPVPPRRLNPSAPHDLEVICLKCLRKNPADRYATARELADELDRFLRGVPIRARPLGPLALGWRLGRRHPAICTLSVVVILLLLALVGGALWTSRRQAALALRASWLAEARTLRADASAGVRTRALAALRQAWHIAPSAEIRDEVIAFLVRPEMELEQTLPASATEARPPALTASKDNAFAAVSRDGNVVVLEVATEREVARFGGYSGSPLPGLDDTGRRLALATSTIGEVEILDVRTGQHLHTLRHPRAVRSIHWSGELLAAGCDNRFIYLWDTTEGALRHRLIGHDAEPSSVRFRNQGQEFCSVAEDMHVRLWHGARGVELLHLASAFDHAPAIWWSRDDGRLFCPRASGASVEVFRVRWARSVRLIAPPQEEPHTENVRTLGVNPDGSLVAVVDENVCRVWETASSRLVGRISKTNHEWMRARFSLDGSRLLLSGWSSGLRSFAIDRRRGEPELGSPQSIEVMPGSLLAAQSDDGRALALLHGDEHCVIVLWPETGRSVRVDHHNPFNAIFSPDGRQLISTSFSEPGARVWSLPEGALLREIATPDIVLQPTFSADGRWLWMRSTAQVTRFSTGTWRQDPTGSRPEPLPFLAWSADGRLAASMAPTEVRLLRAATLEEITRLAVPSAAGWLGGAMLAFSGDSTRLVLHSAIGVVVAWDLPSLRTELRELGMDWRD